PDRKTQQLALEVRRFAPRSRSPRRVAEAPACPREKCSVRQVEWTLRSKLQAMSSPKLARAGPSPTEQYRYRSSRRFADVLQTARPRSKPAAGQPPGPAAEAPPG